MAERNPYAAPTAPVIAADEPTLISSDPDSFEYGGFWRRVGAYLLDCLIMMPMGLLLFGLMFTTSRAYLYFAIPSVVVSLFYFVFLVKRYGGTPGKRITGMRITMTNGSPVTTKAALLRYAPFFLLQTLSLLVMIWATSAPVDDYGSLNFVEKMQALQQHAPRANGLLTGLTYLWWIVTGIVLAANARKRALHDLIAGTVVLRTQ